MRWLVVSGLLVGLALGVASPQGQTAAVRVRWQVLGAARQGQTLYRPAGVAVDRAGHVYVSDAGSFRVVKLSQAGRLLRAWGERGSGPGAFGQACPACTPHGPGSLAVDARGTVFVDDPANARVERFSAAGRFLGSSRPALPEPVSLAPAPGGGVLAAGSGDEVAVLAPGGAVRARWRVQKPGHEGLTLVSVAAAAGAVYVSGWWPDSSHPGIQYHWFVQKLTPAGELLASWQDVGGELAAAGGRVYAGGSLLAPLAGTVAVLDAGGHVTARLGTGRFASIAAVALDAHGNLYVADDEANRVLELSPQGRRLRQWGVGGTEAGRFVAPWDVAVAANGDVFVDDARAAGDYVQRLSAHGKPLAAWQTGVSLHGLGVDARGTVYVLAYPGRSVVRAYAPSGRLAAEWPLADPASRIAADARGDVYVLADCSGLCVEKLRDGRELGRWRLPADSRVVADGPLAADGRGRVYVTDLRPDLRYGIERLTLGAELGIAHVGSASWRQLTGLAVDARGDLYVPDAAGDRVEKLSPAGKLLATWGAAGTRPGRFHRPAGVALDARGDVYVTDSGNSRVQKLTLRR